MPDVVALTDLSAREILLTAHTQPAGLARQSGHVRRPAATPVLGTKATEPSTGNRSRAGDVLSQTRPGSVQHAKCGRRCGRWSRKLGPLFLGVIGTLACPPRGSPGGGVSQQTAWGSFSKGALKTSPRNWPFIAAAVLFTYLAARGREPQRAVVTSGQSTGS